MVTKEKGGRKRETRAGAQPRQRAEEALRESEERFPAILEAAPIPMVISRMSDGLILRASAQLGPTFGLPSEGMIARKTPEFYHDPADRKALLELVKRDGYVRDYELRVRKADGSPFWVVVSVQAITFEGEPALIAGFYDISERKRAEEALRESEARYRELVENINAVILELDGYGRITYISPAVEEMTGYSPSEVIGRYCIEFVDPEDLAAIVHRLQNGPLGDRLPTEFRLLSRCGEILWVQGFHRLILEGDRVVGSRGVMTDVSELKQLEQALQKAREELEDRVEALMERGDPYGLSFRELTVLHLLAAGESDKEIAILLGISPRTASKHVEHILTKMGVCGRTEAGVRAVRENLIA